MSQTVLPTEQCIEQGYCPPKHRATKDTKRWCRGKVGRLHRYQWQADLLYYRIRQPYIVEHPVCLDCGKQRFEYRRVCKSCHLSSTHGDFGSTSWFPRECPMCYMEWEPKKIGEMSERRH